MPSQTRASEQVALRDHAPSAALSPTRSPLGAGVWSTSPNQQPRAMLHAVCSAEIMLSEGSSPRVWSAQRRRPGSTQIHATNGQSGSPCPICRWNNRSPLTPQREARRKSDSRASGPTHKVLLPEDPREYPQKRGRAGQDPDLAARSSCKTNSASSCLLCTQ